ncbi:MAG: 2,3-bisphosphoglycerate-independent phosphoglycerate mutase [Gammaproteobacteria bacterium]
MYLSIPIIEEKHYNSLMSLPFPTTLIVLDGWGESEQPQANAIYQAKTPCWDNLRAKNPYAQLAASGPAVGLPEGQMGNSEVGHTTIGSGRVLLQDLSRIDAALAEGESGTFFQNSLLRQALAQAQQKKQSVHILGMLSPGGVHNHENHIFGLLELCAQYPQLQVHLHGFLDGRDMPPASAGESLIRLDQTLEVLNSKKTPQIQLASLTGRFYAMDRDARWERTQKALHLLLEGHAAFKYPHAKAALEAAYARNETDEFVQASLIEPGFKAIGPDDLVIFTHFRADRTRQLCKGLKTKYPHLHLITFTEYLEGLTPHIVFPSQNLKNGLGEIVAKAGLRQLRIAETEKYAHVTFFFNGGIETAFPLEDRLLIPSPKVDTYDQSPAMSAIELTKALTEAILSRKYEFIVCNYANPDMLGHTGNYEATVSSIEILDQCLSQVLKASDQIGGQVIITADHGNAECMYDTENQQPHTAHTTALVPFVYHGPRAIQFTRTLGTLADVAPSILKLMTLKMSPEMTGQPLF